MKERVLDLVRLVVASIFFVLIEPGVQAAVAWPDPLPQALAIVVSAILSWLLFEVISPFTQVTVEWIDQARGVTLEGNVLDLESKSGTQARIYKLVAGRSTPALVGRLVLGALARRDFRIVVDANQTELLINIESVGVERYTSSEGEGVAVRFGKESHSATSARVDLSLDWSEYSDDSLRAKMRYRAVASGTWGWCLCRLVWVRPKSSTIRKIPHIV